MTQLINKYGGIGHFKLDEKERKIMLDLIGVTSDTTNDALNCDNYKGKYDEQREVFLTSMERLFPHFSLDKLAKRYHIAASSERDSVAFYNDQSTIGSRRISSSIPIAFTYPDKSVALEILLPRDHSTQEGNYFITLCLASGYNPDIVDDLAVKLGQSQDLTVAMPLYYGSSLETKRTLGYSIADVHRLDEVLRIYTTAAERIQELPERLHVTELELNILRRDARTHENLFVRRNSMTLYDEFLEQLADPLFFF